MDTPKRDSPRTVTSRCKIKYRQSSWRVSESEVWSGSGERVCRCVALLTGGAGAGSALLWAGGALPRLEELALGVPAPAAASTLVARSEGAGAAASLARRLAVALHRPVFVCCGATFDRFTQPLVERVLLQHVKATHAHCTR